MPDQQHFKASPLLRPQSAVEIHVAEPACRQDKVTDEERPWTSQSRQRTEFSARKVKRHNLKVSHMKAPQRIHNSATVLQRGSTVDANAEVAVGSESTSAAVISTSHLTKRIDTKIEHAGEGGSHRKHISFDTWVSGSPHDSEEYDTDLEEKKENKGKEISQPLEASGASLYNKQCQKHGFVPVSYLRRHLGKRTIRMRYHYLGGSAVKPLAAAFRHNTVTETLDLSDNYLESEGAAYLAAMLRDNSFIISLNLSNNFIGSYGCLAVADMLDFNTTLRSLSLAGNRLVDQDAILFVEPLKHNTSLTYLDLSHNKFAEIGGIHLGGVVSVNDGLIDLDLSWNSIRKKGAVALANALKINTSLEVLDLSWNGIGADGAAALQFALQVNTTLKVLDLSNNRIDTEACRKLAAGLAKNSGLETLMLNLNPLGDKGVEAVLKSATFHPTLQLLSLENCGELDISQNNARLIRELELDKEIIILHGNVGGYQRNSSQKSLLQLFCRFFGERMAQLETAFNQQDKDHSGILTTAEIKLCLRTAGLKLTNRQLDKLVNEIDCSHIGIVKYREILARCLQSAIKDSRTTCCNFCF